MIILTNDGEAGDGPVAADVVLVRARVVVEVAVLEGGESVVPAVQVGAAVRAVVSVVAAVALIHPPPIVFAAPGIYNTIMNRYSHFYAISSPSLFSIGIIIFYACHPRQCACGM